MFVLFYKKIMECVVIKADPQSSTNAKMIDTPFYAGDLQINGDCGVIAAHLVPYSRKPVIKNKKFGESIEIRNLK